MYIPPEEMPAAYSDVEGGLFHPSTNGVLYNLAPSMSWQMVKNSVSSIVTPIATGDAGSINIIWANHDIFVAKQNASGIGYVATDEVYDYIIDFVDYNGVMLPEITASTLKEYPYALIVSASAEVLNGVGDGYILFTTKSKPMVQLGTMIGEDFDVVYSEGEALAYIYIEQFTNTWTLYDSQSFLEVPINNPDIPMTMLWSNEPITIDDGFEEDSGIVWFPKVSDEVLPEKDHYSTAYAVTADWLYTMATHARKIAVNNVRMTTDSMEEALANNAEYKRIFMKNIEEINFALPESIPLYSFVYFPFLRKINSANTKFIGTYAIIDNPVLETINFPDVVETAVASMRDNPSLKSVSLPSAQKIGVDCF
jgi:hypothetical protein